jgi:hypothetical protein
MSLVIFHVDHTMISIYGNQIFWIPYIASYRLSGFLNISRFDNITFYNKVLYYKFNKKIFRNIQKNN